jgi:hypothetical protein
VKYDKYLAFLLAAFSVAAAVETPLDTVLFRLSETYGKILTYQAEVVLIDPAVG